MIQNKRRIIFPGLAAVLSLVGFALLASLPESPTRAAPGALVNVKLSGEMQPEGGVSTSYGFHVSPDGRYAVYHADAETDEDVDLYSVLTTGESSPVRLNGRESPGRIVGITPDSERVVYLAKAGTDVYELYVAPIDGSSPPQDMNAPVGTFTPFLSSATLSPDGSRVVYFYEDEAGENGLHSVPFNGGPVTQLNTGPATIVVLYDFEISPAADRVVFRARSYNPLTDDWIFELYSVPINGGAPVKLNAPLAAGGDVTYYEISAGGLVVYEADQVVNGRFELYRVPITGGLVVKLNGPLTDGGSVGGPLGFGASFHISPDGSRVVYVANQDVEDRYELYSVPAAGGMAIKLNGPIAGFGLTKLRPFTISDDSKRVVYVADQEEPDEFNLYSVPIGGGPWIQLNYALVKGGDVDQFDISPDSSRVAYLAQQNNVQLMELFSVPIGGGMVTTLSGPKIADVDPLFMSFHFSPDSQYVAYRGSEQDDTRELYRVPITGGPVQKISGEMTPGGKVQYNYQFTSDSERMIYQADQEVNGRFELFATFDDSLLPTPTPTATATATRPPSGGESKVYLPAVVE